MSGRFGIDRRRWRRGGNSDGPRFPGRRFAQPGVGVSRLLSPTFDPAALRPCCALSGRRTLGACLPRASLRGCAATLCPGLTCCGPFGARKRMTFRARYSWRAIFLPGDIPAEQHCFRAVERERHEFAVGCLRLSNPTRLLTSKGLLIRERESSGAIFRQDGSNARVWHVATETRERHSESRVIAKCCKHCG